MINVQATLLDYKLDETKQYLLEEITHNDK